jgi:hypothetical protein
MTGTVYLSSTAGIRSTYKIMNGKPSGRTYAGDYALLAV